MAAEPVSIIIPTHNRASMLKRAVDTALDQTRSCEVLVVDHGSTDRTPEVAAGYGSAIRYLRRERDDGPFVAWLHGVLEATGTYVHFTYDDDWLAPTFIEACAAHMRDDVGLVFTNATIVFPEHQERMLDPAAMDLASGPSDRLLRFLLGSNLTISPGCALLRREVTLRALMTNPVVRDNPYHGAGPDLMMMLMPLLVHPRFAFVPDALAYFRAHPGSITIDALGDAQKGQGLMSAYADYKRFVVEAYQSRGGLPTG